LNKKNRPSGRFFQIISNDYFGASVAGAAGVAGAASVAAGVAGAVDVPAAASAAGASGVAGATTTGVAGAAAGTTTSSVFLLQAVKAIANNDAIKSDFMGFLSRIYQNFAMNNYR
jgi:hypothetical protein